MTGQNDYTPIEIAIGNLYKEFYRLRTTGQIQEEYEALSALIKILQEDKLHLMLKYGKELKLW